MSAYTITVAGNPLPKERPRVVNGHAYTPQRTLQWEGQVRRAWKGPRMEGPLELYATFFRGDRRRVDLDNLAKAVLDGLNGVAWLDDAQIVELHLWKQYDSVYPRLQVMVAEVTE